MDNVVLTHIDKRQTKDFTKEEIDDLLVKGFHRNFTNSLDAFNALDDVDSVSVLSKKIKQFKENDKRRKYITDFITKNINKQSEKSKNEIVMAKNDLKEMDEFITSQNTNLHTLTAEANKYLIKLVKDSVQPDIHHTYTSDIIKKAMELYSDNKRIKQTHAKSRIGVNTSHSTFKGLNHRECTTDKDCDSLNILLKRNQYKCDTVKKRCVKQQTSKGLTHSTANNFLLFNTKDPANKLRPIGPIGPMGPVGPVGPVVGSARYLGPVRPLGPLGPLGPFGTVGTLNSKSPGGPKKRIGIVGHKITPRPLVGPSGSKGGNRKKVTKNK
jgi:hypothetical protein